MSDDHIRFHITGFGPFAGVPTNPSSILISQLVSESDSSIASNYIVEVSTVGANSILQRICEDIDSYKTGVDVFLHFGVAAGASSFHIEQCAYNDADFRVPDVLNYQPREETITPGSRSFSLNTSLDCTELKRLLQVNGGWGDEAVSKSTNPGRFLCNYIYFKSLSAAKEINETQDLNRRRIVSLFVHVPLHSVIDEPSQVRFAFDLISSIKELIRRKRFISDENLSSEKNDDQSYNAIKSGDFTSLSPPAPPPASAPPPPPPPMALLSDSSSLLSTLLELGFNREEAAFALSQLGAVASIETAIEYIEEMQQMGVSERIKLVLVVRSDLEMGKGKIAAQCSHAVLKAYRMLSQYEKGGANGSDKAKKLREIKTLWEGSGEKIVVCRGDGGQEQLEGILDQARRKGVLAGITRDAGKTQVEPGSLTVLFVGPDRESVVDSFTGHLKLL